MRKHGLRSFGLSFMALSAFMAVMAVGAQGSWLHLVSGVALTLANNSLVTVEKHNNGDFTLLLGPKNLEILCTTVQGEDLLLKTSPLGSATGKVSFSGCTTSTISPLTAQAKCNPINQPIKAAGTAQLILHNGVNYVLFSGAPFTTIEFSEECALTETSTVKGSLVAECGHLNGSGVFVGLDCLNHQVTQLLRSAPKALFAADKLIYGLNTEALLDGIAAVKLGAPNVGNAWGGHV
jgi:hypothetical protein